ncbi:Uncharacterised protein [uncultured archaeon]|nr:Uncharacterised protein [uncultured archaeon]
MASILFCCLFAFIYAFGNGINGASEAVDYSKFSLGAAFAPGYVANAVSPGYIGYQPTSWYQIVAWMEAIFGTFMWAAFIATFARKFMR